jgi:hypothetical protein
MSTRLQVRQAQFRRYAGALERWEIVEGAGNTVIAITEEKTTPLKKSLRTWLESRAFKGVLDVRETATHRLLFSLKTRAFSKWRDTVEVVGPGQVFIGFLGNKIVSWAGGFYICNSQRKPTAAATRQAIRENCVFSDLEKTQLAEFRDGKLTISPDLDWEKLPAELLFAGAIAVAIGCFADC